MKELSVEIEISNDYERTTAHDRKLPHDSLPSYQSVETLKVYKSINPL